ncbi:MAG: hypothetical protein J6W37_09290 [Bacteroidales bacterium]|nr:hypothetical protein [Bacteroidales bacterium]
MNDFVISLPNGKVKFEKENLQWIDKETKTFDIPQESFLENPDYESFLFDYKFVVNEQWKDQKGLENHRLLTVGEWDSIFSMRPQKYLHVNINKINGVILMPDDVDFPSKYKPYLSRAKARDLDIEEWHILEEMGSIFLPGANFKDNIINPYALDSQNEGRQIGYWLAPLVAPINANDNFFVRLVKDVEKKD